MKEIQKICKEIDFNNLFYYFKGPNIAPINFIRFRGPLHIFKGIKNGNILLQKAEKEQEQFKSNLVEITEGNPKHKSKDQLDVIKNAKNLYDSRQKVIDLFNDYAKIRSEAIYETKQETKQDKTKQDETRLKILTPKQMLQRLPIALAQIKAGNNSESLLNEIRQIVYSLYQSKEITKKVYNNIIKSIPI